ncbi:MAG TPA: THUMP domain-containing protein [bacterium]|nr:THUMP domain-containing protein [bacterium]
MTEHFFASCPRGLETVLSDELAALGAGGVRLDEGGVHFEGDLSLCYRANLHSRIASRILWRISVSDYHAEQDIYDTASALPWEAWFAVTRTIRVNMVGIKCPLKSLNFAGLRIKDAVCDRFRRLTGERPSVDTANPDIRIHGLLEESRMTLSLDTSGDTLFKRGVRRHTGAAPLRENLAAGILALAGWKPGIPLLDPMCGSGTFLIEAAQMALNIAPGISRSFAFQKLINFDAKSWKDISAQAIAAEREEGTLPIFGSDISAEALETARQNLEEAGLAEAVTLNRADVREVTAPAAEGILVANLPYGERMGDKAALQELYPQLGDALKKRFSGWDAYLFTADLQMAKSIRLATSRRIPLFNGALECRLFAYKMVAGRNQKS